MQFRAGFPPSAVEGVVEDAPRGEPHDGRGRHRAERHQGVLGEAELSRITGARTPSEISLDGGPAVPRPKNTNAPFRGRGDRQSSVRPEAVLCVSPTKSTPLAARGMPAETEQDDVVGPWHCARHDKLCLPIPEPRRSP